MDLFGRIGPDWIDNAKQQEERKMKRARMRVIGRTAAMSLFLSFVVQVGPIWAEPPAAAAPPADESPMAKGRRLVSENDHGKAAQVFLSVARDAKLAPRGRAEAWTHAGISLAKGGAFDRATDAYLEAYALEVELSPDPAAVKRVDLATRVRANCLFLVERYLKDGEPDKAIETLQSVCGRMKWQSRQWAELVVKTVEISVASGQPETALVALNDALGQVEQARDVNIEAALALRQERAMLYVGPLDDAEKAIAEYQAMLALAQGAAARAEVRP